MNSFFKHWKQDIPAGLVVFLVALPLCLGIGLASTNVEGIEGIPNLFSGLIPGVVGGIVVGVFSGSRLGITGPAAGLIAVVLVGIKGLGSYQGFLLVVVLSGVIQIVAAYLKAGVIGNYFPSSVIKGMLAAIGITLILKEIPHVFGYDKDFFGDDRFLQADGHNTFTEIFYAFDAYQVGSIIISLLSLAILILLEQPRFKKIKFFKFLPPALFVVILGILMNGFYLSFIPELVVTKRHLVQLPVAESIGNFVSFFSMPDWSFFTNINTYIYAFTLALIGSLETLLSVEATDKLDPQRYKTPTNVELKAQGIGNIVSGLIGGLPMTQVVVRSTASIGSGAQSKLATIFQGLLLLLSIAFIPQVLNLIPLASLAAILLMIGYKLTRVELFANMYKLGWDQFLPFVGTIIGGLLIDLLNGIGIGMALAIFFILKNNYQNNFMANAEKKDLMNTSSLTIVLSEEVSFLNKGGIADMLEAMNPNTRVTIDGSKCKSIDHDVLEYLKEFSSFTSKNKNIKVELININTK